MENKKQYFFCKCLNDFLKNNMNIEIENPCPMILIRMQKDETNSFFCKSCSKKVVDFRGKSLTEIQSSIKKETCGIFTSDQLQEPKKMTLKRHLVFYGLILLSFFGCSVRPMNTVATKNNSKVTEKKDQSKDINISNEAGTSIKKNTEGRKNKRKLFHRRKGKFTVSGCPSF